VRRDKVSEGIAVILPGNRVILKGSSCSVSDNLYYIGKHISDTDDADSLIEIMRGWVTESDCPGRLIRLATIALLAYAADYKDGKDFKELETFCKQVQKLAEKWD
jgi:hypothetical protein